MRLNVVLPRNDNVSIGGYKIIYQYLNFLCENYEYDIHIYFLVFPNDSLFNSLTKLFLGLTKNRKKNRSISWFQLNRNIHLHFDTFEREILALTEGIVIATHWSTFEAVSGCKISKNNKYYFIQGYETFDSRATESMINNTWKNDIKKIVISNYLLQIGKKLNARPIRKLSNFIDLHSFPIQTTGDNDSKRDSISFLWHENPSKQSPMGLSIVKHIKELYPWINVIIFGTSLPKDIPSFIHSYKNLDANELCRLVYKKSLVYIIPSSSEGWGLTGLEAMSQGAVIASIDNGGINEYATNGVNASIVTNNEEQLTNAIIDLLDSREKREMFQEAGYKTASKFSLDIQGKKFNDLITDKNIWNKSEKEI